MNGRTSQLTRPVETVRDRSIYLQGVTRCKSSGPVDSRLTVSINRKGRAGMKFGLFVADWVTVARPNCYLVNKIDAGAKSLRGRCV